MKNTVLGEVVLESKTGKFSYAPMENNTGEDSFTYTAMDQAGSVSNTAKVTINIMSVNDSPVGEKNISVGLSTNGGTGKLFANGMDNDTLSFVLDDSYQQGPQFGTVTVTTDTSDNCGFFEYKPIVPDQLQDDSFGFVVNDGNGGIYSGVVNISDGNALPSQPILRLPTTDSVVNSSDVRFQRVKSKDNNNEPIEYSLFFCENIQPSTCGGQFPKSL